MHLLAPTALRLAPREMPDKVRARFGSELRRAGAFTQLGLLGALECLDAARGSGPLGLLWASELGARRATQAVLDENLRRGEPAMPFAFIATQPHLAGAFLAQRSHPVARATHLHLPPDAWPRLPQLAQSWLARCARVLIGWVEESGANEAAHRSDWCLLQREPAEGSFRCEAVSDAGTAAAEDWLARIAAWSSAPRAPLVLRGTGGAWSFRR